MAKTILDFEKGDTSPLKDISDKLQDILDKFGAVGQAWKQTSADMSKANTDNANKLQTVIDKVGDVGQAYKKTSDGINVQGKSNVDQTNKLAQSIDAIAVASKSMDKVVIGGAYKNYLKQIQDQLGLTGKELINYIQNARKSAQAEIFNPSNSKEQIDQISLSIKVMNDALKQLGVTEDATGGKTETLRQRIKNVKDQLVAMADAGLEGTPAFVALQEKAGELNKQFTELNKTVTGLGSDTRNINGLISLASGVAGGYAIAQGAAALFGDQNNEVAQALLKVNAAMSILQGLQQVQQILQKDSGASILLNTLFRKQNTEAIAAQTEAMEVQNQVENGAEISTTTATGPVQAVKNVVQSAPVDESAAANTAAITKNTAVVNAAAAAEKGKAIATDISTASTNAQTVSVEGNTVVTGAGTKAIEENTIVKGAGVVATDADIISTNADTGAKVAQTIATEGATAATAEFTAALLANPVTAVVVGVLALVTAIGVLNSNTESAIKLQDEMNNALEEATTGLDADTKSIQNYTKVVIAQAQLRGASAVEISKIQGDANLKELANIKAESDALGEQYNKEIDLFNQVYAYGGKIDKETLDAHAKLLDQKNKLDADYAEKSKALQEEILQHQKLINDENFKSYNAYVQTQVAAQIAGTDAERNAQIASIKQIAAARESDANFQALTDGEKALARANDEKQIQSLQLQNYQHYLKGRTAAVDAEIAIQKAHQATSDADAIANINKITDLQIAAIRKTAAEQIKGNPTLNAGEIKKINDEANLAIVEAEKKKQQDILNVQQKTISDRLAAAEKGSYEEYVYDIILLKNKEDQELVAAGKNQDAIDAIKKKYAKLDQDRDNAFAATQLNDEISRDNAALSRFGISEQDKLELTLKRLDDQQAVEIIGANNNAAKIAEINAKYDEQRRAAIKASIDAQLQLELNALAVYGQKTKALNELILNNATSPEGVKLIANNQVQIDAQKEIDIKKAAAKEEFDTKVITYKEYLVKLEDLKNQEDVINQTHADNELKIFKDTQDKKLALLQNTVTILQAGLDTMDNSGLKTGLTQALGLFTQIGTAINSNAAAQKAADLENDPAKKKALQDAADQQKLENKQKTISAGILATQATLNQVFADYSAQRQQQMNDDLQALEEQKNAELNNANLTAKQKDEINARYAAKEKAVRLAEWKAEQEAKKEQAIINGALAITNIIATVPKFDFGVSTAIMIGAAVAATALQVAAIDKVKPPKFRHGKVDIQGPGTSTSDSIHAMISRGETVIKAESTAKWKDALIAINDDHFEDYLSKKFKSFVFPHVPDNIPMPTGKTQEQIDYEKLATAVAAKMKGIIPAPKSTHVNIDKNGIHTIVEEANSRTEWKNKRFSME